MCDDYKEIKAKALKTVHEKPLESVGVAFGVGLLLGAVVTALATKTG